jgi:aryl sulfotransferase
MLTRPPQRQYLDWITDSRRWDQYVARPDDIVIATAPKCGTTWAQRIVGLLIFNDPAPRSVDDESPWVDLRLVPGDVVHATISNQTHRRYLKSHLPFDCLPLHDDVRYIHVARDGRDACMSIHNMVMGTKANADAASAGAYSAVPERPQEYFRTWLTSSVTEDQADGTPFLSFFDLEVTYWRERARSNLLLVHYNDLRTDLDGEMRRIAAFLGTPIDEAIWPDLVNAATFAEMKKVGARIKPHVTSGTPDGADRFFNKGVSGGWREHLTDSDLAPYWAKVREKFTPGLAAWIEKGRLGAGDPRASRD